jgi:trehalose 6-phosphate synthase
MMKKSGPGIIFTPHVFQWLASARRSTPIDPSRVRQIAGYGTIGAALALLAALLVAPLMKTMISDWSRRDVESRSTLVFNAVQEPLVAMLAAGEVGRIEALFESVAADSRIVGVAFCKSDQQAISSKLMPSSLPCEAIARGATEVFSTLRANGRDMLVASFPLSTREIVGHFVIVHDLTFSERRGIEARNFLSIFLGGIVLLSGATALALVLFLTRRWLQSFRRAVFNVTHNDGRIEHAGSGGLLDQELQLILRQLKAGRAAVDTETVEWNKNTLRTIMEAELPGIEVIVVANREPYIHNTGDNGIELQTPASGLVSAVEPIMRACRGTWIAHGSGSADRDTVDDNDRIAVPPDEPEYTLRRIWITEAEQDGYYYGLANEGLWPLCHIAFTRPTFRSSDWEAYRTINERFADAVVREARTASPIVLVQDYHFALLPRMLRERLPNATIIVFWHIPWPNSETFGIFPWKEQLIHGLLGSTIIGFHTQFHCNNFLETVDRFVESRIDREHEAVIVGGHETLVRPYPISIEWPPAALEEQPPIRQCRANVRKRLGLSEDCKIVVGIERFDYTKGVLDRLRGVESLLTSHPEWIGKFSLVQAAAPTRSKLPAYRKLQEDSIALAEEINSKYAWAGQKPISLVIRHHEPGEVFELFRAADACVVSSLHDGMNLVAKEFVAARDDEMGVLLLSSFAGASRDLSEAIIINPYDAQSLGEAIHQSLTMPATEQHERMKSMRDQVRSRNVYRWAGQILLDASRIRKKQRILEIAGGAR